VATTSYYTKTKIFITVLLMSAFYPGHTPGKHIHIPGALSPPRNHTLCSERRLAYLSPQKA